MRVRRQRVRATVATLLLVALVGLPGTSYAASDGLLVDVPGDGEGFVHGSATPLLNFDDLEPGDLESGTLRMWNDADEPVELGLRVIDLVDGEHGCVEPESNEGGDVTCAPGEGELSQWLSMSVTRTGTGADQVLWAGGFDELDDAQVLASAVPAHARWNLRIDVELLPEAGNDTMTDAVAFSMSWSARGDQVHGQAVVAGVQASRPPGGSGVPLPFTGATVDPWLLWFAGVLTAGGAVLLAVSRRPVRAPAY